MEVGWRESGNKRRALACDRIVGCRRSREFHKFPDCGEASLFLSPLSPCGRGVGGEGESFTPFQIPSGLIASRLSPQIATTKIAFTAPVKDAPQATTVERVRILRFQSKRGDRLRAGRTPVIDAGVLRHNCGGSSDRGASSGSPSVLENRHEVKVTPTSENSTFAPNQTASSVQF
jgi:hypothetical protein